MPLHDQFSLLVVQCFACIQLSCGIIRVCCTMQDACVGVIVVYQEFILDCIIIKVWINS